MKIIEYGKGNRDVIMLLHGGGLSWWQYREAAELLQDMYHVVLPVLDGHAESGRDFTGIEDNAAALIAYIDQHFGGSVLLLGGLSLGAQIAAEMLTQRADVCRYAVLESALVLPMKLTHWLVKPMIGMSSGLIQQDWFSALQFKALGIKEELRAEYVRDTRKITPGNLIAFLKASTAYLFKPDISRTQAKVFIFVGQKEAPKMIRSARRLHAAVAGSVMEIKQQMKHGDFSINHAAEYAKTIRNIIRA